MNYFFSSSSNPLTNNLWLLVNRVILSIFMLTHGISKFDMLIDGNGAQFSDPLSIGSNLSLILAVTGEVLGPILIIPGVITRLATIPAILTMTVAAFIVHASDPFRTREMALLYLAGFLTVLIFGPGRYSIDYLLGRDKSSHNI